MTAAEAPAGRSESVAAGAIGSSESAGADQLDRRDLAWCLAYALLLAAITSLPYLLAAAQRGSDWAFTGFVVAVEDGNSYIAKMLSGQQGAWLFRSPYSAVDQRGVLAFLPYLLLGKLTDGSHAQRVWLYHALRVLALPLLVLAIYRFSAALGLARADRRWVTLLATAGGGLGWVLLTSGASGWLGSPPLEFYSPESFGFLATFGFPHLALARAGMLWGLTLYLTRPTGWAAGAVLLATGILHSPVLIPALAALAAHQLALLLGKKSDPRWRLKFVGAVAPLVPLLAYLGLSLATDPYLQVWAAQNVIRSPHPLHYLVAYGAVLPLAFIGGRRAHGSPAGARWLPLAWAAALPLLAYAPVDLQRRLTEGGWVALLTLAACGLETLSARRARALRLGTAALLLPSSLLLVGGSLINVSQPAPPIYQPREQVAAFEWMAERLDPGSVVLAAYQTGNPLPAWAPVRVLAGHGPESAGLEELVPELERFFSSSASDAQRLEFSRRHGVDVVFYGPAERGLDGWTPAQWPCLRLIFEAGEYQLYEICDE